jgi:hypothetical protein
MVAEIRTLIDKLTEQAKRDSATGRPIADALDRINHLWGWSIVALFVEAGYREDKL